MYILKKWLIVLISVVLLIIGVLIFGVFTRNMDSQEAIIKLYNKNTKDFEDIVKYAEDIDGDLYINKTSNDGDIIKYYKNYEYKNLKVNDVAIQNDIEHMLFKLNFAVISEQDNSVHFVKVSGLGFDRGIIYMKDGREPDGSNNVTKTSKIKDRWYYYENNR